MIGARKLENLKPKSRNRTFVRVKNNEEIIETRNIKSIVRKNTSDSFIVKEVLSSGAYSKLNITNDDVVADIGLNIGMFTLFALSKQAKKVYSYEPDVENYSYAMRNLKLNGIAQSRFSLFNLAVIGNDDTSRPFSLNNKKNKGAHSLIHKRGRSTSTVRCININKVFEKHHPHVVKMDIEGGEYECIKSCSSFEGIREFIIEFHHAHLNDINTHKKYKEILKILRKHFRSVDARKNTKGAWISPIYCRN